MEIGRVKNSDWFRKLPEMERRSVLAALEESTHESAVKLRAGLWFAYATVIYAAAFGFWAGVFGARIVWFAVGGAVVGAIAGLLAANAIAGQKKTEEARDMQWVTARVLGVPGIVLAALGLVVWLVRLTVFH